MLYPKYSEEDDQDKGLNRSNQGEVFGQFAAIVTDAIPQHGDEIEQQAYGQDDILG